MGWSHWDALPLDARIARPLTLIFLTGHPRMNAKLTRVFEDMSRALITNEEKVNVGLQGEAQPCRRPGCYELIPHFGAAGGGAGGARMPRLLAHSVVDRLAICFLLACSMIPARAKSTDLVIMKNGDRLTGEVKKLESGILYFKVPYVSDSIQLDWLQVESVKSGSTFHVVLKDGSHLAGTVTKVPTKTAPGIDFDVSAEGRTERVAGNDVINIERLKRNFWRQLVGSIDFGSDFTSGNGQTAVTSDVNVAYSATKWRAGTSFTSSFSGQSGGSQTNLLDLQTTGERFMNRNDSLLALTDLLHSSQQDLQLRTTLGGGYSKYIFRTNRNLFRWILGAAYAHETFVSSAARPSDQNLEALLGAQYQLLQFNRYNLQSYLLVYPGLSDAGRVRATAKATLNVKLPNNFYTNLSFWENYDSNPPLNAVKSELGISSGIGWSF
jgi:hypothetical protein